MLQEHQIKLAVIFVLYMIDPCLCRPSVSSTAGAPAHLTVPVGYVWVWLAREIKALHTLFEAAMHAYKIDGTHGLTGGVIINR